MGFEVWGPQRSGPSGPSGCGSELPRVDGPAAQAPRAAGVVGGDDARGVELVVIEGPELGVVRAGAQDDVDVGVVEFAEAHAHELVADALVFEGRVERGQLGHEEAAERSGSHHPEPDPHAFEGLLRGIGLTCECRECGQCGPLAGDVLGAVQRPRGARHAGAAKLAVDHGRGAYPMGRVRKGAEALAAVLWWWAAGAWWWGWVFREPEAVSPARERLARLVRRRRWRCAALSVLSTVFVGYALAGIVSELVGAYWGPFR